MDKKYDALDWQSFSQKKNIEEIVKNTKDRNTIQLTAITEIFMTITSIAASNVFADEKYWPIWVGITVLAAIPMVYLLFKFVWRGIKKHFPGNDIPNLQDMIDLFDNDICYYGFNG